MPDYKLRVTLPYQSGLPSDVTVNDFSVFGGSSVLAGIMGAITNFYRVSSGANGPVGQFISPEVSRDSNVCRVDAYDRALPAGSAPVGVLNFTMPAALAGAVQAEQVACCLSMHADLTGVIDHKARRRGRVFIGPLMDSAISFLPPAPVRVSTNLQGALHDSAQALLAGLAALPALWQVWSTVDGVGRTVTGGFIDDALDTMRSRRPKALSRLTW